jgi:hypothetical protein
MVDESLRCACAKQRKINPSLSHALAMNFEIRCTPLPV